MVSVVSACSSVDLSGVVRVIYQIRNYGGLLDGIIYYSKICQSFIGKRKCTEFNAFNIQEISANIQDCMSLHMQ